MHMSGVLNVGTGFMPVRAEHLTRFSSVVVSGAVMITAQKIPGRPIGRG